MKNIANWKRCAGVAAGLALTVLASSAQAAWSFAGKANNNYSGITLTDKVRQADGTLVDVKASFQAFSVANSTTGVNTNKISSGSAFARSTLAIYDQANLGVVSGTETRSSGGGQHAMDNNGRTEMLLVNFTYANGSFANIDLDKLTLGWAGTDTDVSVLRYTGKAAPSTSGNWSTLKDGWELVGDYANVTKTGTPMNDTKGSSWWLISAFNTGFGGVTTANARNTLSGLDMGNDYFKIASLTGTLKPLSVPEPGSMALMGFALVGMLGMRRRKGRTS